MGGLARIELALLMQRGHLFPWVPVFMAVGIGTYFGLGVEPGPETARVVWGSGLILAIGALRWRRGWAAVIWAMSLVSIGFGLAMTRANLIERPVLGWRYYGPVEGRIIGIDRSGSGAMRVLLDQVVLAKISPRRTPERVRVSLHGTGGSAPVPGARVIVTAHLSPPGGPVEPGGFDFQRHAWFKKLGAVGYARTPLLILAPPQPGIGAKDRTAQALLRARLALSARVQAGLPGDSGAFAAAIMSGDRAGISQDTLASLRATNLAHLLAISGLHMGLLTGFVFALLRFVLNLWPGLGLRLPVKKLAALMALIVAAGYLALSGGNIATERAFVMVAVALLAVIADRRVISLRAVALAAVIVLTLWPEALLGPGFQMSFAATTGLVAVFRWLRDAEISLGPRWMRPLAATALSSAIAGLATAPIAAAHFNQISHFGLIANLASVPLMGILVIPAALIAALLMPFGLEGVALRVVGLGVDWILAVAHTVTKWEGTRGAVPSPEWMVLPLLAFGFLLLVLWQGRLRWAGIGPVIVAAAMWGQTQRPDVLISDTGGLVGVLTDTGRALSKPRGAGFIATNWLENDGDPVSQETAAVRWTKVSAWNIRHVTRKADLEALRCARDEIIVTNKPAPGGLTCLVYDPSKLRKTGAVALYRADDGGVRTVSARNVTGERLWNRDRRKRR